MRRTAAALGTSMFFALAPGTVAGLIPWWLTGWHLRHVEVAAWIPVRVLGGILIAAGLPVLVAAFVRFVREGFGTPAPVAPTEHLVVGGLYRYVRNPMYLAVAALIVGVGIAARAARIARLRHDRHHRDGRLRLRIRAAGPQPAVRRRLRRIPPRRPRLVATPPTVAGRIKHRLSGLLVQPARARD